MTGGLPLCFSTLNHAPLFGAGVPLGDQVRAAAAAGFASVSLDVFSVRAALAAGGPSALAAAADAGLPVLDLSALVLSADAEQSAANLGEALVAASVVHPEHVLVKLEGPVDTALLDRLHDAAEALAAVGVLVAVEPSPLGVVPTLAAGGDVLDAAGATELGAGLVLDSWHFFVGADGWPDLAAAPFDRIAYLQLADGHLPTSDDLLAETLHQRSVPGEGSFDLPRFLDAVTGAGWSGTVCAEVLSARRRDQPVDRFAADVAASCTALLAARARAPDVEAGSARS